MNAPQSPDLETIHYWESGWDEHDRLQLLRLARLPLIDKLTWLEEAHHMVLHMAAAKTRRPRSLSEY